ncbi:ribonuclease H-like domain-containing protein [Tanacetum coccineum]
MVTRFRVGIVKANPKYNLHVTTSLPFPQSSFPSPSMILTGNKICVSIIKALIDNNTLGQDTAYLLLYVDDIILTASSTSLLLRIHLPYYMRVFAYDQTLATQTIFSVYLHADSIDIEIRIGGGRTFQQLCLYMHDPREPHLNAMKRVLRYFRGTTDLGLQLLLSTTSQLIAYSDADWACCLATRRSTSGYCVFLGDNLLTWSSKRQDTLSRSSVEAEYRGVAML